MKLARALLNDRNCTMTATLLLALFAFVFVLGTLLNTYIAYGDPSEPLLVVWVLLVLRETYFVYLTIRMLASHVADVAAWYDTPTDLPGGWFSVNMQGVWHFAPEGVLTSSCGRNRAASREHVRPRTITLEGGKRLMLGGRPCVECIKSMKRESAMRGLDRRS